MEISIRFLKGRYGSNCVFWPESARNIEKIKQRTFRVSLEKFILKGQHWSNRIVPNFQKMLEIWVRKICKKYWKTKLILHHISLTKIDENFVKGQYGSNRIVCRFGFKRVLRVPFQEKHSNHCIISIFKSYIYFKALME